MNAIRDRGDFEVDLGSLLGSATAEQDSEALKGQTASQSKAHVAAANDSNAARITHRGEQQRELSASDCAKDYSAEEKKHTLTKIIVERGERTREEERLMDQKRDKR